MSLTLPTLTTAARTLFAVCADPRSEYTDGVKITTALHDETPSGNDFLADGSSQQFIWKASAMNGHGGLSASKGDGAVMLHCPDTSTASSLKNLDKVFGMNGVTGSACVYAFALNLPYSGSQNADIMSLFGRSRWVERNGGQFVVSAPGIMRSPQMNAPYANFNDPQYAHGSPALPFGRPVSVSVACVRVAPGLADQYYYVDGTLVHTDYSIPLGTYDGADENAVVGANSPAVADFTFGADQDRRFGGCFIGEVGAIVCTYYAAPTLNATAINTTASKADAAVLSSYLTTKYATLTSLSSRSPASFVHGGGRMMSTYRVRTTNVPDLVRDLLPANQRQQYVVGSFNTTFANNNAEVVRRLLPLFDPSRQNVFLEEDWDSGVAGDPATLVAQYVSRLWAARDAGFYPIATTPVVYNDVSTGGVTNVAAIVAALLAVPDPNCPWLWGGSRRIIRFDTHPEVASSTPNATYRFTDDGVCAYLTAAGMAFWAGVESPVIAQCLSDVLTLPLLPTKRPRANATGGRSVPFSDTFARADGTPGNGWVDSANAFAITGGVLSGGGKLLSGTGELLDEGLISFTIPADNGGPTPKVYVRYQDSLNYVALCFNSVGLLGIIEFENGTQVQQLFANTYGTTTLPGSVYRVYVQNAPDPQTLLACCRIVVTTTDTAGILRGQKEFFVTSVRLRQPGQWGVGDGGFTSVTRSPLPATILGGTSSPIPDGSQGVIPLVVIGDSLLDANGPILRATQVLGASLSKTIAYVNEAHAGYGTLNYNPGTSSQFSGYGRDPLDRVITRANTIGARVLWYSLGTNDSTNPSVQTKAVVKAIYRAQIDCLIAHIPTLMEVVLSPPVTPVAGSVPPARAGGWDANSEAAVAQYGAACSELVTEYAAAGGAVKVSLGDVATGPYIAATPNAAGDGIHPGSPAKQVQGDNIAAVLAPVYRRLNAALVPQATSLSISAPASGAVGRPSIITFVPVGGVLSDTVILSDGAGGVFSPPALTWIGDQAVKTSFYTPSTAGVKTIIATSSLPTITTAFTSTPVLPVNPLAPRYPSSMGHTLPLVNDNVASGYTDRDRVISAVGWGGIYPTDNTAGTDYLGVSAITGLPLAITTHPYSSSNFHTSVIGDLGLALSALVNAISELNSTESALLTLAERAEFSEGKSEPIRWLQEKSLEMTRELNCFLGKTDALGLYNPASTNTNVVPAVPAFITALPKSPYPTDLGRNWPHTKNDN